MKFNKLLASFPPPSFIDVPFSALVFSDANVRLLTLDHSKKHPFIHLEIPIEVGVIEAGTIKREEELLKTLVDLRSRVETPFVKFAVPDEVSYVFTARLPVVANRDAGESVSSILEENVPLPLADISFDFTPTNLEKTAAGFFSKMVVTAVSSSISRGYVDILRKAGFEPIFCTNESQSIARSIIPQNSTGNSAIIYIHRNIVGIYITEGSLVEFSSIVTVSENPGSDSLASSVVTEFSKALNYWREKNPKGDGINSPALIPCLLCGKHDACNAIMGDIAKIPNVSASLGNVWVNLFSLENYIPEISFEDSLRFAGAVGLFL